VNFLKRIQAILGIGLTAGVQTPAPEFYKPYAEPHVNFLYNLLFCDDINLFKNEKNAHGNDLWPTLLAEQANPKALQDIAHDESNEGRVRAIAFNRLRASGQKVPAKKVLGVIVEMPQPQGLDVLAAFVEGGVRYLNQSGKVAVFEGRGNPVEAMAKQLVAISQSVVDRTGPWEKARLPPPQAAKVRMTFLVSDGLYFGEGPFNALQKDPLGGPVLTKAAQLLQLSVQTALRK
jgi:hypothetical protein